MKDEARYAANYALFRYQHFDSVNGQELNPEKLLRSVLTDGSVYFKFCHTAKQTLKNMRYVDMTSEKLLPNPPCLNT